MTNENESIFTLDELSGLVDLPRRTVRYYIQMELLDKPEGAGRGAHYTTRHLNQLLEIRKWQQAGLSLERIGEILKPGNDESPLPPIRARQKGTVEVRSHVVIDEGVELVIDPKQAGLSPEEVRSLAASVVAAYNELVIKRDE